MTTTDAAVKTGEGNALRIGQIVTINGKQYQVSRLQDSVWVKQAGRNFAAQPVNKKTGKGWQAERLFMLGEIDAIDAQRPVSNSYVLAADKMQHAMQVRDAIRTFAAAYKDHEIEVHRMANRMDEIAKQIGLAALTLKAAGV